MRFFGLKSCDTCRKARKALNAAGREPQVTDVRDDGLSVQDRTAIADAFGAAAINRVSATWRALPEADRALPVADLLAAHPLAMKRPVIEAAGVWHIGWGPDVQAALLSGQDQG